MSAQDFKGRLETTKQEILLVNAKMLALDQAKEKAIEMGDGAAAIKSKHDARALQERLEDLTITKAALEAKLRICKTNEAKALQIRKRLAEEVYPAGLAKYEKVVRVQAELQPALDEFTTFNNTMIALVNEHNELLGGDVIYMPGFNVPREFYAAASVKLEPLPKVLDIRLASQREEDRLNTLFKEQEPTVSKILKHINIAWPLCQTCGGKMLAYRKSLDLPPFKLDANKGYAFLRCPRHGEQTRDISFPTQPEMMVGKGPTSLPSVVAALPPNLTSSQDLASIPSLATDKKGGGKTK